MYTHIGSSHTQWIDPKTSSSSSSSSERNSVAISSNTAGEIWFLHRVSNGFNQATWAASLQYTVVSITTE